MPRLTRSRPTVESAEAALAEAQAQLDQATGSLAEACARRGELGEDPDGFRANERVIADLEADQRRISQHVIPARQADVAEARRQAQHAAFDAKRSELAKLYRQRRSGRGTSRRPQPR